LAWKADVQEVGSSLEWSAIMPHVAGGQSVVMLTREDHGNNERLAIYLDHIGEDEVDSLDFRAWIDDAKKVAANQEGSGVIRFTNVDGSADESAGNWPHIMDHAAFDVYLRGAYPALDEAPAAPGV
jgi:hypothetical protein